MPGLSDEQVFGAPSPWPAAPVASTSQDGTPEADVFQGGTTPVEGNAAPTPLSLQTQPQSDEQVFGTPVDPNWGGFDKVTKPASTKMPGYIESAMLGVKDAIMEGGQSVEVALGKRPSDYTPANSAVTSPYDWQDLYHPIDQGVPKFIYGFSKTFPSLVAAISAGSVGTLAGGPWVGLGAGAVGFGAMQAAQVIGPVFARELKRTPNDPEGAWERAKTSAEISGGAGAASWALFALKGFEGPIKQLAFQAFGVQPGVSVAEQVAHNVSEGRPATENLGQAAVAGGVGAAVPMAGHAAVRGIVRRFTPSAPITEGDILGSGYRNPVPPRRGGQEIQPGEYSGELGPEPPPQGQPVQPSPVPPDSPFAQKVPPGSEDYGNGWTINRSADNPRDFEVRHNGSLQGIGSEDGMRRWIGERAKGAPPKATEPDQLDPELVTRANQVRDTEAQKVAGEGPKSIDEMRREISNVEEELRNTTDEKTRERLSNVVDFWKKRISWEERVQQRPEGETAPKQELQRSTTGLKRLHDILGLRLYGEPAMMGMTTVKELFQNSFDAVKGAIEKLGTKGGHINIGVDPSSGKVTFLDNGTGMNAKILSEAFFQPGGTFKEGKQASGGFGLAKMLYLFGNHGIVLHTMRDGVVHSLSSTGKQIRAWLEEGGPGPQLHTRRPTDADRAMFPDGHGTYVELMIPKRFTDEKGQQQGIALFDHPRYYEGLKNSPLFHDQVLVTFNGVPVEGTGTLFPAEQYSPLTKMKFDWGTADLYVTKDKQDDPGYNNVTVLSNGIYQFGEKLRFNPGNWMSKTVPFKFFLDIHPDNKPGEGTYPFDLNRMGFTKGPGEDVQNILNHVARLYRFEDLKSTQMLNYGDVQYLQEENGIVTPSKRVALIPPKPKETQVAAAHFHQGGKVVVHNGKMTIDGKELPALTAADFEKEGGIEDVQTLKVPQSEVDPLHPMLHDNVNIKFSDLDTKSMTEAGRSMFGPQFDVALHDLGMIFIKLRNDVVTVMNEAFNRSRTEPQHREYAPSVPWDTNYDAMLEDAVGISFDTRYRGVSPSIPFRGSFVNPAIPEAKDPARTAVGIFFTMVHELAHHKARTGKDGHDAEFPAEMQRILYNLMTTPGYDLYEPLRQIHTQVSEHQAIYDWFNDIYSGAYDLSSRGSRLSTGTGQEGIGTRPRTVASLGGLSGEQQSGLPLRTPVGQEITRPSTGRPDVSLRIKEEGHVGDFDRGARQREYANAERSSGDPELDSPYPSTEVDTLYSAVNKLGGGRGGKPPGGKPPSGPSTGGAPQHATLKMAVAADRMLAIHKWGYGLDRLVDKFPFFQPLRTYAERIREMRGYTSQVHDAALRISKAWQRLGTDGGPLVNLIDDIANMRYRTPDEQARNIQRHPTRDEFQALARKYGVSGDAIKVFNKQKAFFETMVDELTKLAIESAQRNIKDPNALIDQVDKIRKQRQTLLKKPYFPFVRFGKHFVTVRDKSNNVVHFEVFERSGLRTAEAMQQAGKVELQKQFPEAHGFSVKDGILADTVAPFVGLPPALLEAIGRELGLSSTQQAALDQLRYEYSPQASFVQHLRHKSYTPGYSKDFLRAFSRYGFHIGRYAGRVKYSWALRDQIANARRYEGNTAGAIANYMDDHLQKTVLDTKGDFSFFKGAIFLWVFGYCPAGATINLSQVPLISYPWLAAKFGGAGIGDVRANTALAKAGANIKNFYKKGSYDNATDFEMRAFDYGIKSGRITEAMASQLAALAQGENLLSFGGTKLQRGFQAFMEKAPLFFELSEQFNRRLTYRAALDLAMKHPNSIGVKEAMNKYADEYQQLLANFTPQEARAVVTAAHATEQTQFVYARETRPRFMRGRTAGTLFVFKTYLLNVLQLLGANRSSVMPRYMMMMMALGGVMGLPGAEDIGDIISTLGKWLLGKDFNPELAARQLLHDLGTEKIPPDVILHGLARRGFGLPALIDMMGEHPGRGLSAEPAHNMPFPVVDMSKSIGMGRLLPFELGRFLNPQGDAPGAIAATAQQASGAVFGVGFNLFKAIQAYRAAPKNDIKIWEKVMPRELASVSRAYRAFTEGRERSTRGGSESADTIVPYNVRDTEQLAEVIAMAGGYIPLRQSSKWDAIIAESEVKSKFAFEREILMKQLFEALSGKDPEEIDRVKKAMRDYNQNLPKWGKGYALTAKGVITSMQSRFKGRAIRESGHEPTRKLNPLQQHIQSLFPESVVDVRQVR